MSLSKLTNLTADVPEDATGELAGEAPFLADSYAEDWERLERYATRRRFSRGEEIVREGEIDRSLIVLLSGELVFVATSSTGDERTLNTIEAPSLVGEVGFFDPGPRTGALRARSDGELLRLGFSQFESLASSSPSLARMILLDAGRIVSRRLRRATAAALE